MKKVKILNLLVVAALLSSQASGYSDDAVYESNSGDTRIITVTSYEANGDVCKLNLNSSDLNVIGSTLDNDPELTSQIDERPPLDLTTIPYCEIKTSNQIKEQLSNETSYTAGHVKVAGLGLVTAAVAYAGICAVTSSRPNVANHSGWLEDKGEKTFWFASILCYPVHWGMNKVNPFDPLEHE